MLCFANNPICNEYCCKLVSISYNKEVHELVPTFVVDVARAIFLDFSIQVVKDEAEPIRKERQHL